MAVTCSILGTVLAARIRTAGGPLTVPVSSSDQEPGTEKGGHAGGASEDPQSLFLPHAILGAKGSLISLLLFPSPNLSAMFEQDVSGASTSGLGDCTGKLEKGLPCVL